LPLEVVVIDRFRAASDRGKNEQRKCEQRKAHAMNSRREVRQNFILRECRTWIKRNTKVAKPQSAGGVLLANVRTPLRVAANLHHLYGLRARIAVRRRLRRDRTQPGAGH